MRTKLSRSLSATSRGRTVVMLATALIAVMIAAAAIFSLRYRREAPSADFIVRVRLRHNVSGARLNPQGDLIILEHGLRDPVNVPFHSEEIDVSVSEDGIIVGARLFRTDRLRIRPAPDEAMGLEGTLYTGDLVMVKKNGLMDIINFVELEEYLEGVVPREMHWWWPMETLKAQAIAARSYVLGRALARRGAGYDVTADTRTQVYGGMTAWNWRTSEAVRASSGKVLMFEDRLLSGYYHSCCGGHTQDIARKWQQEIGALRGSACPWCRWSPYYRWQERIDTSELETLFRGAGYHISRLDDIRPGTRDASRRLKNVRVRAAGQWIDMPTRLFRGIVGRGRIRSANFSVKKYPRFYLFRGYGWGHGVGMCQWGAFFMGLRRSSSDRILAHYYQGVEVVPMRSLPGWEL